MTSIVRRGRYGLVNRGFAKDEIDVQLHKGVLSITAKRSEQHEESGDGAKVEAELRDGVLTLTIPTPEQAKPKQIEINDA